MDQQQWLRSLKPGSPVVQIVGNSNFDYLIVSIVGRTRIHCGNYIFNRDNGAEIDRAIGYDVLTISGSYIREPTTEELETKKFMNPF